jgi:hypothetical protein
MKFAAIVAEREAFGNNGAINRMADSERIER